MQAMACKNCIDPNASYDSAQCQMKTPPANLCTHPKWTRFVSLLFTVVPFLLLVNGALLASAVAIYKWKAGRDAPDEQEDLPGEKVDENDNFQP